MRSDVRVVALAQKSIWSVTATASSLLFTSRRGSATRVSSSNRPWPSGCSTVAGVKSAGRAAWLGTRVTVTHASGAGADIAGWRW